MVVDARRGKRLGGNRVAIVPFRSPATKAKALMALVLGV
jgi:hypothetical protein